MKNIKIKKNIAEYNIDNKKLIRQLYYKNQYLIDCEVSIDFESVEINYNLENLECGITILEKDLLDKLKFLINCSKLEILENKYFIDLELQNLYYDFSYQTKLLDRNFINNEFGIINQDFLKKYKCLIGQVINSKYTYQDYYQGGLDLLKNNKITKDIFELENLKDIVDKLIYLYKMEDKYIIENKIIVNKKSYKINKYISTISYIFLILILVYSSFTTFKIIPNNNSYLKAYDDFISNKYGKVIENLSHINYEKIPKQIKYILAVSYIYSEPFSIEQKNVILSNVTPQSDMKIYDYWICLGKLEYDKAIDISKQLGDNEYLIYSYLNKLSELKNNTEINGEKKQKQIDEINLEIEKAVQEINKKNNAKSILD